MKVGILVNNERTIRDLLIRYPHLYGLQCEGEVLEYQDQSCSLAYLNVQTLINKTDALKKDIPYLSSKDVFYILYCHAKSASLAQQKEELFDSRFDPNIKIKDLRVTSQQDKEGFIKTYIYFIDEDNQPYMIEHAFCDRILELYYQLRTEENHPVTLGELQTAFREEPFNFHQELTFERYFEAVTQDIPFDLEQQKRIQEFETYFSLMVQYQKYLSPTLHEEFVQYLTKIEELNQKEEKTSKEIQFVQRLSQYLSFASPQLVRKLSSNQSGYFNGILLIGLVLILGISLGCFLMLLK